MFLYIGIVSSSSDLLILTYWFCFEKITFYFERPFIRAAFFFVVAWWIDFDFDQVMLLNAPKPA